MSERFAAVVTVQCLKQVFIVGEAFSEPQRKEKRKCSGSDSCPDWHLEME